LANNTDKLAPHPVLERYYETLDVRQQAVDEMFDESAQFYDRVTGAMSFGSGTWYREDALKRTGVTAGSAVLDVGAGTGAVTLPAQRLAGETGIVVALDPSAGMLACGVERGIQRAVRGFGAGIPFPDESFDFVTMGYALRHVSDLMEARLPCNCLLLNRI
jgi:demethylmenaquinone methyltransferase/2-methoxy-6-polyprenyl-1,4-benzoquinol methylase